MQHNEHSLRELGLTEIRRLATTRGIKRTLHGKEKQKEVLIREILEQHASHEAHSNSTDGTPSSTAVGIPVASVVSPPSLDHAEGDLGLKEVRRRATTRGIKRTLHGKEKQSVLRRLDASGAYSELSQKERERLSMPVRMAVGCVCLPASAR